MDQAKKQRGLVHAVCEHRHPRRGTTSTAAGVRATVIVAMASAFPPIDR